MSFQLGLADGYGGMGVPRIGSEATLDAPLELCSAGLELEAELRGLEELCPQTDSPPPKPENTLGTGPAGDMPPVPPIATQKSSQKGSRVISAQRSRSGLLAV